MKRLVINYQVLLYVLALTLVFQALSSQTVSSKRNTKGTIPPYLTKAPEIPYGGEVLLVPNVRPVIVLQGSDYDMGYQHAGYMGSEGSIGSI